MLWHFQTGRAGYQFVESERWMGSIGVKYVVGVDGISLFMIVLTALLFPIGLLASAKLHQPGQGVHHAWMLLLEAALIGVFLALDLIVFFVFFEVVLVPMYFIILGWGHDRRNYAALKFFLYTMAGSAFLLVGLLSLAFLHQSRHRPPDVRPADAPAWTRLASTQGTAGWLFLAFFAAFAVKVPLFPLHTWLPDAHTEAPTAGSVILASVLLKMGTYGFLRFSLTLFPQASVDLAPPPRAGDDRHHLRRHRRDAAEPETFGRVLIASRTWASSWSASSPSPHRASKGGMLHDDQPRGSPPVRSSSSSGCSTTAGTPSTSVRGGCGSRCRSSAGCSARPRSRRSACPASPASSASSSR